MSLFKKTLLPVFLATLWISLSEFLRNEILFKSFWQEHYARLGLDFPDAPMNGAVWGLWSILFAVAIFIFMKKYSWLQATLLAWLVGFVLMWVVISNLGVLPVRLLTFAIPLSLLECGLAAFIIKKLA